MEYFLKIVVMIRPIVEFTQFLTIPLVLRTMARHMTPPGKQREEDVTGVSDLLSLSVRKGPESQRFWPKLSWWFKLQLDLNWRILTWQSNFCWQGSDFDQSKVQSRWSCCFYWKLLFDQNHGEMDFPGSPHSQVILVSLGGILGPSGGHWGDEILHLPTETTCSIVGRGQQRVLPGPDCSSDEGNLVQWQMGFGVKSRVVEQP